MSTRRHEPSAGGVSRLASSRHGIRIAVEDPRGSEVLELQQRHLAFAQEHSPPEDVHALAPVGLLDPALTLLGARDDDGRLLGIGALKQLDQQHAEIKSMHTDVSARGRGVGAALLDHLLGLARDRGCTRISLETGTMQAFAPARQLYATAGFSVCPPFGEYGDSPNSVCMTRQLD